METDPYRGFKRLALRVKRPYFDQIVSGVKTVEFRSNTPHWKKMCFGAMIAVFICGKDVHRRWIRVIELTETPDSVDSEIVTTPLCFAIHLNDEAPPYEDE